MIITVQKMRFLICTGMLTLFSLTLHSQDDKNKSDTDKLFSIRKIITSKAAPAPDLKSDAPTPTKTPVPSLKAQREESNRLFRKDVILQINEIIQKVQTDYPALSKKLSDKKKSEILKSLVNTLNRGMEYVPAGEMKTKQTSTEKTDDAMPAIMIASNQVLYIRLNSFSEKSLKQLKEDCESSAKLAEKPVGIIIDLRNSHGFNYESVVNAVALFASGENMTEFNLKSKIKQLLKTPVILLAGGETTGAPEVFAGLLIAMKRAISLGEKTAGVPFEKQKFTLSNGDYLMIPQVPETLEMVVPESIKPSIQFAPYPQLSYKRLKEEAGAVADDKCIQRAAELILCLNALSK